MVAAVRLVVVGAVDVLLFLALARLLRIREVTTVIATLTRRSAAHPDAGDAPTMR